jgi:hypothetical protein
MMARITVAETTVAAVVIGVGAVSPAASGAAGRKTGRHRVQRLGGFDLDAHRVTWAERTVTVGRGGRLRRAPTRIAAAALG